jgi:hypothetical protein
MPLSGHCTWEKHPSVVIRLGKAQGHQDPHLLGPRVHQRMLLRGWIAQIAVVAIVASALAGVGMRRMVAFAAFLALGSAPVICACRSRVGWPFFYKHWLDILHSATTRPTLAESLWLHFATLSLRSCTSLIRQKACCDSMLHFANHFHLINMSIWSTCLNIWSTCPNIWSTCPNIWSTCPIIWSTCPDPLHWL